MTITYQVTYPRYMENHNIIKFSMLCPGISQNTKHHHLTLHKGQVWRTKSYLELCDNNFVQVQYNLGHAGEILEQNGELVPPGFNGNPLARGYSRSSFWPKLPYESDILQSFVKLVYISHITLDEWDGNFDERVEQAWQVRVVNSRCADRYFRPEANGGNGTFFYIYNI